MADESAVLYKLMKDNVVGNMGGVGEKWFVEAGNVKDRIPLMQPILSGR
jgi:hypothetical protein